ncbi:hypothetical protein GWI33_020781 [Rhynchophorus ferrugineus]|uniref:Uncharacterized protein n=1 Tax=Rhynchophorus ferrugineus TaxID=354439 RepID=A0A834HQP6_RHYFE|nr:hypothetical protein GWI33_020781 [Rhynchophorus ferrugineus]
MVVCENHFVLSSECYIEYKESYRIVFKKEFETKRIRERFSREKHSFAYDQRILEESTQNILINCYKHSNRNKASHTEIILVN